MSDRINILETSCVSRRERLGLWSQALMGLCGPFELDGYDAGTIDGHIATANIGRLKLCRIEASRHRIAQPIAVPSPDHHQVIKVLLQVSGTSVFEQGGQRIAVSAGDCLAYDVSQPHRILSPDETKHLVIVVPKDMALDYGLRLYDISGQRFSSCSGLGRLTHSLVETVLEDGNAFGAEHEGGLAEMVLRSLQLSLATSGTQFVLGARQRLVQQAKHFVERNLRNPDLNVNEIAAALNCSARYLHMSFAEEGTTITKHIWSARLDLCRRELTRPANNEKSITEVAFSCGFNSSSHFSRAFKTRYGISPSRIRR